MRKTRVCLCLPLILLGWMLAASSVRAAELQVVTEEYPPFNHLDESGNVAGISTEIVHLVLGETGLPYRITLMPWARAYQTAREGKNVFIYSMFRSEKRESLFQWIGKVSPFTASLYGLKGRDLKIEAIQDARAYTVGTINNNYLEQYLSDRGFIFSAWDRTSSPESNLNKILLKRIDLTPLPDPVARFLFAKPEYQDRFAPYFRLPLPADAGLYLAASLDTDPAVMDAVRAALKRVVADGRYGALYKKHSLPGPERKK